MSKEVEIRDALCPLAFTEKPLATGWDSDVYRQGDQVLKVYRRTREDEKTPPPLEKLLIYWHITDMVIEISNRESLSYTPPLSEKLYPIKINPITAIYKCKRCGFIKSLSPYIPGPNLIMEPREFDLEYITEGLEELSVALEKKINVSGIRIIPVNIKRSDDILIVTDLSPDINNLRNRY